MRDKRLKLSEFLISHNFMCVFRIHIRLHANYTHAVPFINIVTYMPIQCKIHTWIVV